MSKSHGGLAYNTQVRYLAGAGLTSETVRSVDLLHPHHGILLDASMADLGLGDDLLPRLGLLGGRHDGEGLLAWCQMKFYMPLAATSPGGCILGSHTWSCVLVGNCSDEKKKGTTRG